MNYLYQIAYLGKRKLPPPADNNPQVFVCWDKTENWDELLNNFPDVFEERNRTTSFDTIAAKNGKRFIYGDIHNDLYKPDGLSISLYHDPEYLDREERPYFYFDYKDRPVILFADVEKLMNKMSLAEIKEIVIEYINKTKHI